MTGLRVVAIVQARMGSTRLPGKVLAEIGGLPMLVHVVERVRRCHEVHDVWVATTAEAADDAIERLCRERTYSFYRGSTQDVLERYVQAARLARADVIVRLTADCPLLDPALVDLTVRAFLDAASSRPGRQSTPRSAHLSDRTRHRGRLSPWAGTRLARGGRAAISASMSFPTCTILPGGFASCAWMPRRPGSR